jgi:hypothetical protein
MNSKHNVPKILNEIVEYLKQVKLIAEESVGGEGRAGSLKDEQNVVALIKAHNRFGPLVVSNEDAFPEKIKITKRISKKIKKEKKKKSEARKVGDLLIRDPESGMICVINIKTTSGSTDNAFSKLGLLIALTDIPLSDLPDSIDWDKWTELVYKHKANIPGRDYWYLVLDKTDMSHIIIRGAKQINNWIPNPSNDLQISWKEEWSMPPADSSFNEAFDKILNGLKICKAKLALNTLALIFGDNPKLQKRAEDHLRSFIPQRRKKTIKLDVTLFTE